MEVLRRKEGEFSRASSRLAWQEGICVPFLCTKSRTLWTSLHIKLEVTRRVSLCHVRAKWILCCTQSRTHTTQHKTHAQECPCFSRVSKEQNRIELCGQSKKDVSWYIFFHPSYILKKESTEMTMTMSMTMKLKRWNAPAASDEAMCNSSWPKQLVTFIKRVTWLLWCGRKERITPLLGPMFPVKELPKKKETHSIIHTHGRN